MKDLDLPRFVRGGFDSKDYSIFVNVDVMAYTCWYYE